MLRPLRRKCPLAMKCFAAVIFALISAFGFVLHLASGFSPRDGAKCLVPEDDQLILAHTIFRHGNRLPNSKIYQNNPVSDESFFWPEGYGRLTLAGKLLEYRLGQSLRARYDQFLGDVYVPNYLEARTTNADRTKMSLQLVLAGLWPPTAKERFLPSLAWQPIPFNVESSDKEISGHHICPKFTNALRVVKNSNAIQQKLSIYADVFDYIYNQTGEVFNTPEKIFDLYFDSVGQIDYGYPVEEWLQPIFPDTLAHITKENYYIETNTTVLKKVAGGFLLRKIIEDSQKKINGTSTKKLYLYAAHERNIAFFLITLGVYEHKIPAPGSQVIVELRNVKGVYGFKVFYHDWTEDEPKLLTIPGCEAFCPFDDFVSLLSDVIPEDSDC